MSFDERGHKPAESLYFVFGCTESEKKLAGTFPTVESFLGETGSWAEPAAVRENHSPKILSAAACQGKEAMGALRFHEGHLKPGQTKDYLLVMGIAKTTDEAETNFQQFNSRVQFDVAWENNKEFWTKKARAIQLTTGDKMFNSWFSWVTLQPVFRRIFGCSFLPDFDYGKGGKGWRDIWQDLLSLILIEPGTIRETLLNNFAGVRLDGSNATIIGEAPGEFIADRNAITRVWMDHGVWPFLTTLLYLNQTGDYDLLWERVPYFRDPQLSRTFKKDRDWTEAYGRQWKSRDGKVYYGTIIEHILVQQLVPFFNVGEHNLLRLESADWNDGLDMAFARGESVAFSSLYAGNLLSLADLLDTLRCQKGINSIRLARELGVLLDSLGNEPCDYAQAEVKRRRLFERYFPEVEPELSGEQIDVDVLALTQDLRNKGHWLFDHIRRQERVVVRRDNREYDWFNGYYDNTGLQVEGEHAKVVRMTLTGQVFPLMSGLVSRGEVPALIASVERFLRDSKMGGYRLNTDFGLRHYLDLGRAFGFAYGTKENGAFFSHMNVMYAYSLYKQNFVREGYEVLRSIYRMSVHSQRSKIYPGIPEYFDAEGRGMYCYLTGSASWFLLTQLTQAFGVRGEGGDLVLEPKLVKEQFNRKGGVEVSCTFAGKGLRVLYHNPRRLDFGEYQVKDISLNGQPCNEEIKAPGSVRIPRSKLCSSGENQLTVLLG